MADGKSELLLDARNGVWLSFLVATSSVAELKRVDDGALHVTAGVENPSESVNVAASVMRDLESFMMGLDRERKQACRRLE